QLTDYLKESPNLLNNWNSFYPTILSFIESGKQYHRLIFERIVVIGDNHLDLSFSKGINNLCGSSEVRDFELFYLIKLCLTGKNNLSNNIKKKIKTIFLQFKIDDETLTSRITIDKKICGVIYRGSVETINNPSHSNPFVAEGSNLKEIQDSFKSFFSNKLELPFLKNASYHDDKYIVHPITFATYFSLFFLDSQRTFKVFVEDQSYFWRKRTLQILLKLNGIPLISFFQTLLAENKFYKSKVEKFKAKLISKLESSDNNLTDWEKRFVQLSERKVELEKLKNTFVDNFEEKYHLEIEKQIDEEIKLSQSKLHQLQTKEIIILQEIQHHGGDFQPKKRHKKHPHHELDKNTQFSLFLPKSNQNTPNQEKIENLIGDYYLNLSQTEICESEIRELESKKENEYKKTQQIERKSSNNINEELIKLDNSITELLAKQMELLDDSEIKEHFTNVSSLIRRDIDKEETCILNCINFLKNHYREIHETKLINFFHRLKDNFKLFNPPELHSIMFSKNYIPKILFKEFGEMSFISLPEDQKMNFIICFYFSLFQISIEGDGKIPSVLQINLPDNFKNLKDFYLKIIQTLLNNDEKQNYQIIFA
ncbi:MAG: hypothetical protein OEV44_09410, partial [Spirochaetota bacterium]|nr:hypothetical protein [Spirochaetota bacterium]